MYEKSYVVSLNSNFQEIETLTGITAVISIQGTFKQTDGTKRNISQYVDSSSFNFIYVSSSNVLTSRNSESSGTLYITLRYIK